MGGEKFQKLQSDPPLQLSTKEYVNISLSRDMEMPDLELRRAVSPLGVRCPLDAVAIQSRRWKL